MKFKFLFLTIGLLFGFAMVEAQDKKPDFNKMREAKKELNAAFEKEIFPSLEGEHEKLMASLSSEDKKKVAELRDAFENLKSQQRAAIKKAKESMNEEMDPIDKKEILYKTKAPYAEKMKVLKETELKPLIKKNEEALKKAMDALNPTLEKWKGMKSDIMREARGGEAQQQHEKKERTKGDRKKKALKATQFLLWDGTLESAQKVFLKKGRGKGKKK